MPPILAFFLTLIGIAGLFYLEHDPRERTSPGLWVATIWILIAGSRPVSLWFGGGARGVGTQAYVEGSPVDRAIFTGLVVAGLIVLFPRVQQVGRVLRTNWPVVLYFAYCLFSILWSSFPEVSFKRWIKALGDVVVVLIILTERNRLAAIKRIFARGAFILLPMSVCLIKYFPSLGRELSASWVLMYCGVTEHKSSLGMICLLFGLATLWRLTWEFRQPRSRIRQRHLLVHFVILGMVAWLFAMAKSTTSLMCFLIGAVLMWASFRKWFTRHPAWVHGLVLVIIGTVAFAIFGGSDMVEMVGKDPTITGRTEVWHLALSIAGNPVVGTGFESFWLGPRLDEIRSTTRADLTQAHNGYLETYLNLGGIGVGLLLLIIFVGYAHTWRAYRQQPDPGRLQFIYCVLAIIYNYTEATFQLLAPVWIFFLLSTMALPETQALPQAQQSPAPAEPRPAEMEAPLAASPGWRETW